MQNKPYMLGQVVRFIIPEGKRNNYAEWFLYLVDHDILAVVTKFYRDFEEVNCTILHMDKGLLALKKSNTLYTERETVELASYYGEV